MVIMFANEKLINEDIKNEVVKDLDELCRMITSFSRSLNGSTEPRAGSFNSVEQRAKS